MKILLKILDSFLISILVCLSLFIWFASLIFLSENYNNYLIVATCTSMAAGLIFYKRIRIVLLKKIKNIKALSTILLMVSFGFLIVGNNHISEQKKKNNELALAKKQQNLIKQEEEKLAKEKKLQQDLIEFASKKNKIIEIIEEELKDNNYDYVKKLTGSYLFTEDQDIKKYHVLANNEIIAKQRKENEKLLAKQRKENEKLLPRSISGDKGKYFLVKEEKNGTMITAWHKRVGLEYTDFTKTEINCNTLKYRELGSSEKSFEAIKINPTKWTELVKNSSKYDLVRFVCKNNNSNIDKINLLNWTIQENKSPIDDSQNIYLFTNSIQNITGDLFGIQYKPELIIRCLENTTSVYLTFKEHFMSDIQGYGKITYRVDNKKAKTISFRVSTDNKSLGLWNGGQAIPFIKQLFNGNNLFIKVTPYGSSPITFNLDISGLEKVIDPLRKSCNW